MQTEVRYETIKHGFQANSSPWVDLGCGVKRSKFNFLRKQVMLHIKLKGITNAAAGSKYFARRTLPTHHHHRPEPRLGLKGQTSTFSEHGHVAYQIKENHKCSNMVANILPANYLSPPPPPPPPPPPRHWEWGQ